MSGILPIAGSLGGGNQTSLSTLALFPMSALGRGNQGWYFLYNTCSLPPELEEPRKSYNYYVSHV